MYDMYPDTWPSSEPQRPRAVVVERPRRRIRKVHSVLPAVLLAVGPAGFPRPTD